MATCSDRSKPSESGEKCAVIPSNKAEVKTPSQYKEAHSKELLNVGRNAFEAKFLLNPRKTFKPGPSSVLQSVKDFLPVLSTANHELEKKMENIPRSEFDIENVDNFSGPVIEMDLALFKEDSDQSDSDYELDSDENHKSNDDISSDDSDDEIVLPCGEVTEKSLKLPKTQKNKRADIVELSSETNDSIEESISR
ncbi:NOP protein chaperone 1-like [Ptychodera flava]|uniref:NOP protein chaperone 1-like n=1 Tax=Ptychodera flava TaxID=63121 RepID=UPI00396A724E